MNRARLEADQLSVLGNASFQISTVDVSTRGTFEKSASFEFIGSANTITGDFLNHGTATFTDATVRQSDASITNSETGVLQFQNSSLTSGELANEGQIVSNGTSSITATVDNRGTIDLLDGELGFRHGTSEIGIEVPSGTTIKFSGNFDFTGDVGVTGAGGASFVAGRQNFGSSTFQIAGPVSITGNSSVNFDSAVEFTSLVVDRGAITGQGSLVLHGETSLNLARPIDIAGSITVHDNLAIQSSNIQSKAGVLIASGAKVNVTNFESTLGSDIANRGAITLSDAVTKLDSGRLTNEPGGTVSLLNASLQRGTFTNEGLLRTAGTSTIQSAFENRSDVEIASGQLTLSRAGSSNQTINIPTDTTLRLQSETFSMTGSAELTGSGTLELQGGTLQTEQPLSLVSGMRLQGYGTVSGDVTNTAGLVPQVRRRRVEPSTSKASIRSTLPAPSKQTCSAPANSRTTCYPCLKLPR